MQRAMRMMTLALLASSTALAQSEPMPAEVTNMFHAAQARGDSLASLGFLAPDVVIFESGGVEVSREDYRHHHLPLDVQFAAATKREVIDQRTWFEGDVAWVLTRAKVTGEFRDRVINSLGVETMILRLSPDGWRIVHIHWSSRREG